MDKDEFFQLFGEKLNDELNPVSPPLFQTSNFVFNSVEDYKDAMKDEFSHHLYSRGNNPTVQLLRNKIANIQQTEDALVFSSGMAAIASSIYTFANKGDHIICVDQVYGWTRAFLAQLQEKMGIEVSFLKSRAFNTIETIIKANTSIIYLESPTSLLFEMQDIHHVANIAKNKNILTIMDHSYGGLLNAYPIQAGIDIVLHSASKFIGGHSDVVAGVVCGSERHMREIFHFGIMTLGGSISPFDAWLMIRSLRTLKLRINQSIETTKQLISFLEKNEHVAKIYSPFHQNEALAIKQLSTIMPMFTIQLNETDVNKISAFCNAFEHVRIGPSWGGHESLIFPTCIFTDDDHRSEYPSNLVRFYIGLDEFETLRNDFERAFTVL